LLRKTVISFLCAGAFAAPATAHAATAIRGQTLMPGVIYSRQVEFTAHGPVVLHVIAAPRPTGLYALKPILSNNAVLGRERVTSMERRVSGDATVARCTTARAARSSRGGREVPSARSKFSPDDAPPAQGRCASTRRLAGWNAWVMVLTMFGFQGRTVNGGRRSNR